MRALFETSVLVAAFFEEHEHHEDSLRVFRRATTHTGCCAAHTLAEIYAVTTRLPGRLRLSGDQALLLVENVRARLEIVHLDGNDYFDAINQAAASDIVGGSIYDTLLLACAIKAKAGVIYTWNLAHFQRIDPARARIIKNPR